MPRGRSSRERTVEKLGLLTGWPGARFELFRWRGQQITAPRLAAAMLVALKSPSRLVGVDDIPDRHRAGWPQQQRVIDIIADLFVFVCPVAANLGKTLLARISRRVERGTSGAERGDRHKCK